ncbi:Optineurin [Larimichthys crocea]|uniref:Uncharacterized protein n=1 Tax=Larimichthys crocea TaxID=215358 RepID=A0ACD3Q6C9_LARCR|nr:Optineurin [Larimichthys crocea]
MASGGPVMNGDISRSSSQSGTLEETLQQMNILIQENRDLKEALRQTNLTMKERFRGSGCVAGEAAGGAGLPGEQAGRGSEAHGSTDAPKPGAEPETGKGWEDRGLNGGVIQSEHRD